MTRPNASERQVASTVRDSRRVAWLIPVVAVTMLGQLAMMLRCSPSELADRLSFDFRGAVLMNAGFWLLFSCLAVTLWKLLLVARYRPFAPPADAGALPSLTVIVPAYNEGAQVLKTIQSILASDYPAEKLEIVAIDDGSKDDTWNWIEQGRDLDRVRVKGVRFPRNRGKREGLYEGFRQARGEIVVTIDSDSEVLPDTLRNLVAPLVADPSVGGVGGNVRVLNERGLISRMLDVWYTFSFEFMRASESQVGTVSCCPGALSAYRRALVDAFRDEWVSQTFLGRPAAIGEDRALTNLVLRRGHKVLFQSNAVVLTEVPTTYVQLCKMLLRWARSDVRETLVLAGFAFTRFREGSLLGTRVNLVWSALQMLLAGLFFIPSFVVPALFPSAIPAVLAGVVAMAVFLAGLYLAMRGSPKALFAIPYVFLATFGISWITPYSLLTPQKSSWLTRTLPASKPIALPTMRPSLDKNIVEEQPRLAA